MKHTSYIPLVVLLGALGGGLVTGCKPAPETTDATSAKAIDKQFAEVRTAADDAAKDLSTYTHAQKKEFVAAMEAQLAEMDRSLDELSASIAKSSLAVKAQAEPRLAALRVKKDGLVKQLEAVKGSDASTWEMVKTTTSDAYDDLKQGFSDMRQWLGEKLAP